MFFVGYTKLSDLLDACPATMGHPVHLCGTTVTNTGSIFSRQTAELHLQFLIASIPAVFYCKWVVYRTDYDPLTKEAIRSDGRTMADLEAKVDELENTVRSILVAKGYKPHHAFVSVPQGVDLITATRAGIIMPERVLEGVA